MDIVTGTKMSCLDEQQVNIMIMNILNAITSQINACVEGVVSFYDCIVVTCQIK